MEDAIPGKFRKWGELDPASFEISDKGVQWGEHHFPIERILLDPLAWQAVGKAREWSEPKMVKTVYEDQGLEAQATGCFAQQLLFTAYLADGKTIEEALAAID